MECVYTNPTFFDPTNRLEVLLEQSECSFLSFGPRPYIHAIPIGEKYGNFLVLQVCHDYTLNVCFEGRQIV